MPSSLGQTPPALERSPCWRGSRGAPWRRVRRTARRVRALEPLRGLLTQRQRGHPPVALAGDAERRAAGHHHSDFGTGPEQRLGNASAPRRAGARSCPARPAPGVGQVSRPRPGVRSEREGSYPHRLGDRRPDQLGIRERGELDPPCPPRVAFQHMGGHLEREPGLAAAPGSGQGQQARGRELLPHLLELALAAHEAAQRIWQVVRHCVGQVQRSEGLAQVPIATGRGPTRGSAPRWCCSRQIRR